MIVTVNPLATGSTLLCSRFEHVTYIIMQYACSPEETFLLERFSRNSEAKKYFLVSTCIIMLIGGSNI